MKSHKNTLLIISLVLVTILASSSCKKKNKDEEITNTGWNISKYENFEYNMTYITKISFGGSLSTSKDVEVAAFHNNECRGFTKLIFDESINSYICLMTIYSNSTYGETINLKIYNPDKKKIYSPSKSLIFKSNSSEGSADEIINCED